MPLADIAEESFRSIPVMQEEGEVAYAFNQYHLISAPVVDADDRLVRISDTFAPLDMEFWVLTHPDLRRTARVRAFMTHVYEELAYKIDLYAGLTRKPGRWLLELPPLPASGGRPS